ncbi:uncharacterized protein LOC131155722 [Malania oleifera]|uniref:uncharacterized protein LOC131155722 n=1 Tax=Malania oleifera TaxID=397392 RepID=UPI0025AE9E37|nr:uncharacterized protein LOC131155722 [Malania oleifera]
MAVLRSRKSLPSRSPSQALEKEALEPATPAKPYEHYPSCSVPSSSHLSGALGFGSDSVSGAVRRRSLRLASKPNPNGESTGEASVSVSVRKRKSLDGEDESGSANEGNDSIVDKVRVSEQKMGMDGSGYCLENSRISNGRSKSSKKAKETGKLEDLVGMKVGEEHESRNGFLRLRSGARVAKRGRDVVGIGSVAIENESSYCVCEREREATDKEVDRVLRDRRGEGVVAEKLVKEAIADRVRFSREDEEHKSVKDALLSNGTALVGLNLQAKAKKLSTDTVLGSICSRLKNTPSLPPVTRLSKRKLDAAGADITQVENEDCESVQGKGVRTSKRKGILLDEIQQDVGAEELEKEPSSDENGCVKGRRRFSKQEKGKGKLVEDALLPNDNPVTLNVEPKDKNSIEDIISDAVWLKGNVALQVEKQVIETKPTGNSSRATEYKERFRHIARKNASRFAHFTPQEEEDHASVEADQEMPSREAGQEIEDWPGPFSTAMKIIKDRAMHLNKQQNFSSDKCNSVPLKWHPRVDKGCQNLEPLVPSLQELCLAVLARNAESITSLEHVPDEFRHKLSQSLCDSRRMTGHFIDLLFCGCPTEVRIRDCSWLTEEQFTRTFDQCDSNNLTVLQLDQCGRCMPDYILLATLAQSSNCLPALTTISLKGACRLSDVGLSALLRAAPALKSINLSQCSLLSSSSIDALADSHGSVLRELYIDDCQSIDAMHILPALQKLEHLEVLSLAGLQSVCDDFIRSFIIMRGQNMKELILTDCVKLTDSSLKVIAETCSSLSALDLVNLCKLTDSAIGYLANGCQAIQRLKLCRHAFSDEAVAAFLETCGESLLELSLNNVNKIGHHTAMSLARRARKLLRLDLSWCRKLSNEALGLIVDSCTSLKVLKLFGCSQISDVFLDGHSNKQVKIIGLKLAPILEHL